MARFKNLSLEIYSQVRECSRLIPHGHGPIDVESIAFGDEYRSRSLSVSKEEILDFSGYYDPLFHHIGEETCALKGIQLSASGIHILALCQKLACEVFYGRLVYVVGSEISSYKMRRPLYPDESFSILLRVLDKTSHKTDNNKKWVSLSITILADSGARIGEYFIVVLALSSW